MILNYTTKIAAAKTVGECQAMLAKAGASAVATMYETGRAVGLSFVLDTVDGSRTFTMPVEVDGVHALLLKQKVARSLQTPEQAERVAWRILKDWLEAQLAMVAAQMVTLDVIMLPYLQIDGGRTLVDRYRDYGTKAIEA